MVLRFGDDFEIDGQRRRLRRAGRHVRLERIPMEILLILVERSDQIVTREEIAERIWGQGVFLDTDNSIRGAIRKIRLALRDDAEQPRFIQTVIGRGYRFIAAIRPYEEPVTIAAEAQAHRPLLPISFGILLAAVAALAAATGFAMFGRKPEARTSATSPQQAEAHDLYLKGRFFWNQRTPQSFDRAVDLFNQAIASAPDYAPAYAGLADTYALMAGYNLVPQSDVVPMARAAASRAVALDDTLAEAHTSLAVIAQDYDWDFAAAEREYRRALALDSTYATAHHWYGELLGFLGRFDEAFTELDRARELDPLSLIIATDRATVMLYARQYDRAVEEFRRVLSVDPNFSRAAMITYAYVWDGLFAEAIAQAETRYAMNDAPWDWALLTYVYGRAGRVAQAQPTLHKLEDLSRHQRIDPAAAIVAYLGVGDKPRALSLLETAVDEHSPSVIALKVDPLYDDLRTDPRFTDLLRRVRLGP
jgi:DNA-binding winged helix-turn-helix (wHTH) protein/Tfp pilus assembly protein PilF